MKIALAVLLVTLVAIPVAAARPPAFPATEQQIREYRDSGGWARDVAKVARNAKAWVRFRTRPRHTPRLPALVLDIDETSLDNYPCLDERGGIPYNAAVYAGCVVGYDAPAWDPIRSLFNLARRRGVSVFFITARPEPIRNGTQQNLIAAGYTGNDFLFRKYFLFLKPSTDHNTSAVPYKSGTRKAIERFGFTIIANVGDQRSDLMGGAAERRFKLPNPVYFTP
jgi:predicted secreted acid phosphatase